MEDLSMSNPVVHFQIGGRNAAALRGFYQEVFGWVVDEPMPIGAIRTGTGTGVDGGLHQVDDNQKPYLAVYVAVDDLLGTVATAERLGAEIIVPPTDVNGVGSFAMFQDPEGNCIGLWDTGSGS
jgi:predicted enzyme related to lactoylglutathione lyase